MATFSQEVSTPHVTRGLLDELHRDLSVTRWVVLGFFVMGVLVISVWGFAECKHYTVPLLFSAFASFAIGALGGFLFGIPRVLQKSDRSAAPALRSQEAALGSADTYELLINTNLDDISDWLTKIVVGVGLVELRQIPGTIYKYAALISGKDHTERAPLVCALVIYFAVLGFMSGYLTTRMFFERAFRIADLLAEGAGLPKLQVVETETHTVSAGVGETH